MYWITQPSAPVPGSHRGGKSWGGWRVGAQPRVPPRTFSVTQQRRYLDFQAFSTGYVFGNSKIAVTSKPVKLLSIGNKKPSLKSAALNSPGFGFSSCWSPGELTKGNDQFFCPRVQLSVQPTTRVAPYFPLGPHQTPPLCQEVVKDCIGCFRAFYLHCKWKPLSGTSEAVQSHWL